MQISDAIGNSSDPIGMYNVYILAFFKFYFHPFFAAVVVVAISLSFSV